MFSRAHLLIERDYENFQRDNPWGIEVHPLKEDNLFEWTSNITGLKGSLWEGSGSAVVTTHLQLIHSIAIIASKNQTQTGGSFRLYLKFDEHYNSRPPKVCFHTIPFHPNVDMVTGRPCVDFLDDWTCWKSTYDLRYILMSIQMMLCNPVLEGAVNIEAVHMLQYSPHAYHQMVQDCVAASQRVKAGLWPHSGLDGVGLVPPQSEAPRNLAIRSSPRRTAKVSFQDYYATWNEIATSKPNSDIDNAVLEAIKNSGGLQDTHYGQAGEELYNRVEQQHTAPKYSKAERKLPGSDSKQTKLNRVQKMRKVYLQSQSSRKAAVQQGKMSHQQGHSSFHQDKPHQDTGLEPGPTLGKSEEAWDEEADALVEWTHTLDGNAL